MQDSEIFAIAARLHVVLRRAAGRVTDVQWMTSNHEYALEVIRIAREKADPELLDLAVKFEAAVTARQRELAAPRIVPAGPVSSGKPTAVEALASRYVGRLR